MSTYRPALEGPLLGNNRGLMKEKRYTTHATHTVQHVPAQLVEMLLQKWHFLYFLDAESLKKKN